MGYITVQFETRSWQRFINYVLAHYPEGLLILRNRTGKRPYQSLVEAALSEQNPETISIEKVALPGRVRTAMWYFGINTLGQLAQMSVRDLTDLKNFGERSLQAVMDLLHRYGLSLRDETPAR